MKKHGKILALVAAIVACLAMAVCLTACNDKSAEVKDIYLSKGTLAEDDNEYETKIHTTNSVILYTDGTYALETYIYGYMGAYGNSQVMQSCTISIGTYTLTDSTEDEELATLELSKPTRIIINSTVTAAGTTYRDTADDSTFAESDTTAAETLESGKALTLTVNTEKKSINAGL